MTDQYWINAELSRELSGLRQRGENQSLEFKRELPKQASDFAKEIAAFASSNEGLILLGVADNGELVGLPDVADSVGRDALCQRIEGICRIVKPPVHPESLWAVESGHTVLVIRVPKGREALYYVDHRPYIRRSTSSRPAEPAEVVDAVRNFLANGNAGASADPSVQAFFSKLAGILVQICRWGDTDINFRNISPWLEQWTNDARYSAANLRDLSAEHAALDYGLTERLEHLASLLDVIVKFTPAFGSAQNFNAVTDDVCVAAKVLFEQVVVPRGVDKASSDQVRKDIEKVSRKLTDSWARAEKEPLDGAVTEGQRESSIIGMRLMEYSYFPLEFLTPEKAKSLLKIGQRLLALETERLYYDGGESYRRVASKGATFATDLRVFIESTNQ